MEAYYFKDDKKTRWFDKIRKFAATAWGQLAQGKGNRRSLGEVFVLQ